MRLGVLLLLFDVYLTWARIEKQGLPASSHVLNQLAQQPIIIQYMFFRKPPPTLPASRLYCPPGLTPPVLHCTLSTLAFHLSIRLLTSTALSPLPALGLLPRYPRPNSVSTALLVSSSTKLFPILMVIWEYDVPAAARSLGWAVVANNVEALKILLGCSYGVAALLAGVGALARWGVGRAVFAAVGIEGMDDGLGIRALWGAGGWLAELWEGVK